MITASMHCSPSYHNGPHYLKSLTFFYIFGTNTHMLTKPYRPQVLVIFPKWWYWSSSFTKEYFLSVESICFLRIVLNPQTFNFLSKQGCQTTSGIGDERGLGLVLYFLEKRFLELYLCQEGIQNRSILSYIIKDGLTEDQITQLESLGLRHLYQNCSLESQNWTSFPSLDLHFEAFVFTLWRVVFFFVYTFTLFSFTGWYDYVSLDCICKNSIKSEIVK